MYLIDPKAQTRRAFLRRSAQLAFTGAALPTAMNLASIGEAAAFTADAGSYKALVCVFLYGGNDYANTVVAYDDPSHAAYNTIRGGSAGIALQKAQLANTVLTPTTAPTDVLGRSRQYALHPSMTGLAGLFNAGQAAVQLNVGPLVTPLTRAQFQGSNRTLYPLPPKLFSHNDQQSMWQASATEGATVGWGGNLGDLAMQSNTSSLFTCISVTGNSVFLSGDAALAYQVGTGGSVKIRSATDSNTYGSSQVKQAMLSLTQQQNRPNLLENEYCAVTRRAISSEGAITSGIGSGAALGTGTEFAALNALTNNPLAAQLKMVARLIAARDSLAVRRQVFFVSLGGFDLHDNLIGNQATNMQRVSDAMTAFYQATVGLNVASDVTSFTASDFGRTLASNGDGSDHGWGNHHLMVGGAVNGKAFYGTPPPVSVGNGSGPEDQWHVGSGRLLPSTSVDQYAATLSRWFGVQETEFAGILPNIGRFGGAGYPVNLGFMK